MPHPGPLRGHVRLQLIRDLALDAVSETELAARFGVTQQAVSRFRAAHSAEIESARLAIEDEFAALWSADKAARVAELQDDVERINEALESASVENLAPLVRAKLAALRAVAEELGQLAPKAINTTVSVRYSVDGVDMDRLR